MEMAEARAPVICPCLWPSCLSVMRQNVQCTPCVMSTLQALALRIRRTICTHAVPDAVIFCPDKRSHLLWWVGLVTARSHASRSCFISGVRFPQAQLRRVGVESRSGTSIASSAMAAIKSTASSPEAAGRPTSTATRSPAAVSAILDADLDWAAVAATPPGATTSQATQPPDPGPPAASSDVQRPQQPQSSRRAEPKAPSSPHERMAAVSSANALRNAARKPQQKNSKWNPDAPWQT